MLKPFSYELQNDMGTWHCGRGTGVRDWLAYTVRTGTLVGLVYRVDMSFLVAMLSGPFTLKPKI